MKRRRPEWALLSLEPGTPAIPVLWLRDHSPAPPPGPSRVLAAGMTATPPKEPVSWVPTLGPAAEGPEAPWVRAVFPCAGFARALSLLTGSNAASQATHPTVRALLWAPSAANGNFSEPLTSFEGPDLAEVPLMGSYLSRASPGLPSPTRSEWELPSRPARLWPSLFPRRVPVAFRVHPVAPSLNLTRRLSYEDLVASPRRQHRRQLVVHHRQRYPIQQARCLFLRVFPSASSEEKKPLLSVSSSRMSCASEIMKLASAKGKLTLRLALEQSVLTIWSSLAGHFSVPNAKKSSMRPLEESSQVKAKEEKDLTTVGRERVGKEEDHHTVPERQDERGSEASETVQSAFRCLLVNGAFASFVPRPGPLKREFCYKSSANSLIKKSQTSIMSCNKRNAITSSYSSTQGFQLQQERNGASTAGFWRLASSHLQASANKASEEGHQASSSVSVVPQKQIKHEKSVETPLDKQQNQRIRSPSFDLSRPKKRKIPLLLPYRRNDPLIMPPPLELGYPVTAEILDLEKRAAIQWINKVLKDDEAKTQSN